MGIVLESIGDLGHIFRLFRNLVLMRRGILIGLFGLTFWTLQAQQVSEYLRANAIPIPDAETLPDTLHAMFRPFQVVMMGEMHGTNEPARFVGRLAELCLRMGDSVQVGLEIPASEMEDFLRMRTDSSIATSRFFDSPRFESGRESVAWATLIGGLKERPNVQLFFFDVAEGEGKPFERDSLMAAKIRNQYLLHPTWKLLTLSGNAHAMLPKQGPNGNTSMAAVLARDKAMGPSTRICTLNHLYSSGTCRANFGHGLEEKQLIRPQSEYDTALPVDEYLVFFSAKSSYPYTGIYYSRRVTASEMVRGR